MNMNMNMIYEQMTHKNLIRNLLCAFIFEASSLLNSDNAYEIDFKTYTYIYISLWCVHISSYADRNKSENFCSSISLI